MLTHFHRIPAILIRLSFVLLVLFACLSLLFHSRTSSVSSSNRINPQSQRQCRSCPPPSPRRIYAPAIDLSEAQSCEIVLNSRSANPIDITPTFYTASGNAIVGNPIQLQPAEIRFVPVEQLMPRSIRGTQRWGGIALSYVGNVLEVWAQITFHGIGGGSIDETFNILEEPGSDTREAVWRMPPRSTAIVALGNSSSTAVRTNVQFSGGDSQEIEIPAGMTKFVRRHAQGNHSQTESVRIVTVDSPGAVRLAGFIVSNNQSFASSIRFYDTKGTVQPNLYAINLRLKNTTPRIVLKNTSDAPVAARPHFLTANGEQDNPVELTPVTIAPQQTIDLDLNDLRAAAASRTDFDSVSVRIENSGAPGSLIGAAYSTDNATGLTYDLPLRDTGRNRNGAGSYPWRVDNDYSTVVAITNVGNQAARFQVEIRYTGGPYSIKPRELKAGETATFDLAKIRDEQQPDRTGKTLPLDLNQGQFHWSMVASPGDTHILGRAEVKSRTGRVASSYSCFVCCQDSGPYGGFDPHAYGLFIDGFAQVGTNGGYVDCYSNFYSSGVWFSSMWTWNSSIATLDGDELHGEGTGSTGLDGIYDRMEWWSDGMDCYPFWSQPGDNAPVDVSPHIDSISPAASAVGHPVTVTLSGKGFAQGATIDAGAGVNVSEITVSSATSMSAIFSVAANATAGNRNVTVTVNGQISNSKTFTVQVPDRLRVVSDTGNFSLANCPSVVGRIINYQVSDSTANHTAITQAISVVEAFENQTTNTCGNGQPLNASCEPTDDSGQFRDGITITTTCNSTVVAVCNANPSCGYEHTQKWLTCFPEAVIELMSAPGITHCNQIKINNSTQLGGGTLMPK